MGGRALKNCTTRRYQAEEYFKLVDEVSQKFAAHFGRNIWPIAAYKSKESFGDMDVLIESEGLPPDWVQQTVKLFGSKEYVKNGNVLSLEYKEFQIDFIVTPLRELDPSLSYFAFNDLGNLIGRVAHAMGLKLGHDGLSFNWRVDTYQFRNIVLLTDWEDILLVLGYSYERYARGFDTLEDIFKFVVSSPFFNKDIYLLHNRNHTSRVRDAKRRTYMEFLKWIEDPDNLPQPWNYCKKEDKKDWLPYLFAEIKGFEETYNAVQAEWDQAVELKRRFNGELVKQWTGTDGRELGLFMKWLKQECGESLLRDVCAMNPEVVEAYVKYFYDKYLGKLPVMHFDEEAMKTHRVK